MAPAADELAAGPEVRTDRVASELAARAIACDNPDHQRGDASGMRESYPRAAPHPIGMDLG